MVNESASVTMGTGQYNRTDCKYYDRGPPEQCYRSDEHLMNAIYEYIYPRPHEWFFLVLYIIVFFFGVIGNFLVCYAVWRNRHLRTTTNFFLVNLAVADFLVITLCLPPSYAQTMWETWFLGLAMCKIVEFYQYVSVTVSILTLTAISVERWFAICKPLTFKETRTRVTVALIVIWVTAHVASVPRLVIFTEKSDGIVPRNLTVLMTSCAPADDMKVVAFNYDIFVIIAFYILPIIVMGYTYFAIAICLWSSIRTGQNLTEGAQSAVTSQVRARRRTAKMLIVVVVVFILCFLPIYTWNLMRITSNPLVKQLDPQFVSISTLFAHWLIYLNSSINPVIYNFMSGKFRKEFKAACACWFTSCSDDAKKKHNSHHALPILQITEPDTESGNMNPLT